MCCFLWMCSTARKKYSQLQNRFITFPASQSSVGFVSSSPDCLFSSGLQHEKHTHSHRLSFRETLEMFFFFSPSFQRHWYRLSAGLTASISRRYGRNNKANPNCGAQISLIPGWHSAKSLQSYMRNTIPRANLTKKVQQGYFIRNAGPLHHGRAFFFSFLLSFLSSRLRFIKLTVTQCALSLGAIPIYSPHHHCRPRRPQTLSAASHQPSAHYPSHRRMLGQY